ncbi:MAG: hypothetical protein Athens071425_369 [Parcubacteria group bacterium Athens0714_25]|nr:MAG: hypothetical protein Athens071425_369 [Parcubacteria group bacterium Athens0714_25]
MEISKEKKIIVIVLVVLIWIIAGLLAFSFLNKNRAVTVPGQTVNVSENGNEEKQKLPSVEEIQAALEEKVSIEDTSSLSSPEEIQAALEEKVPEDEASFLSSEEIQSALNEKAK